MGNTATPEALKNLSLMLDSARVVLSFMTDSVGSISK